MFAKIKMFFAIKKLIKVFKGEKKMTKGIGTSEFWVVIVFSVLSVVNKLFGLGISEDTLQQLALAIAAYIGGRSAIKVADAIKGKKE